MLVALRIVTTSLVCHPFKHFSKSYFWTTKKTMGKMNFSTHQPNFRADTWYPGMPHPDPEYTTDTQEHHHRHSATTRPINLNCLRCWGQVSESLQSDWALFQLCQGLHGTRGCKEIIHQKRIMTPEMPFPLPPNIQHCPLRSSLLQNHRQHLLELC